MVRLLFLINSVCPIFLQLSIIILGLFVQPPGQGDVQAHHNQLLGTDECQPDTGHHHVQTGQEEEGSVWTPSWKENCE